MKLIQTMIKSGDFMKDYQAEFLNFAIQNNPNVPEYNASKLRSELMLEN